MQLTTARLLLREFTMGDFDAVYAYESDPAVVQYLAYGPYSEEESLHDLAFHVDHQDTQPRQFFHLAITLLSNRQLIGWCGLEVSQHDERIAELGFVLHHQYWGHAYALEAARALLHYGFSDLHLHRIFATCDLRNTSSRRVLQKLAMRQEGHLLQDKWIKGAWHDSLLYALLDHEWRTSDSISKS